MNKMPFATRTLKEILRDPLSIIFSLLFPSILFILFKIIATSASIEEVPQFKTENLIYSIALFSHTFLMLFSGLLITKDRHQEFLTRLKISPMRTIDYFIGYMLPFILIMLCQEVLCLIFGVIFKMHVNIYTILAFIPIIICGIMFIFIGILFGSICSEQSIGGASSIIISFTCVLSGMVMPVKLMGNTITTLVSIFPFYHYLEIAQNISNNTLSDVTFISYIVIYIYLIVIILLAIITFKNKVEQEK